MLSIPISIMLLVVLAKSYTFYGTVPPVEVDLETRQLIPRPP